MERKISKIEKLMIAFNEECNGSEALVSQEFIKGLFKKHYKTLYRKVWQIDKKNISPKIFTSPGVTLNGNQESTTI